MQTRGRGLEQITVSEVVQLVVTALGWTKANLHLTFTYHRIFLLKLWVVSHSSFPFWKLPFLSGTVFFRLPLRVTNEFQLGTQPSLTSWSFHLSFGSRSRTSLKPLNWNVCSQPSAPCSITSYIHFPNYSLGWCSFPFFSEVLGGKHTDAAMTLLRHRELSWAEGGMSEAELAGQQTTHFQSLWVRCCLVVC